MGLPWFWGDVVLTTSLVDRLDEKAAIGVPFVSLAYREVEMLDEKGCPMHKNRAPAANRWLGFNAFQALYELDFYQAGKRVSAAWDRWENHPAFFAAK